MTRVNAGAVPVARRVADFLFIGQAMLLENSDHLLSCIEWIVVENFLYLRSYIEWDAGSATWLYIPPFAGSAFW